MKKTALITVTGATKFAMQEAFDEAATQIISGDTSGSNESDDSSYRFAASDADLAELLAEVFGDAIAYRTDSGEGGDEDDEVQAERFRALGRHLGIEISD